jgi:hypothetical protein
MKITLSSLCLLMALAFAPASQAARTHITEVARQAAPPPGKALVNIHRIGGVGPFGADIRIPIFDETGKFLMDLPNKSECQLVFEPGTKSLITWFQSAPLNVVTMDLAPDKTYDLIFDAGIMTAPSLIPLSQASRGVRNIDKLENKIARKVYALDRDEVALAFESSQKDHLAQIKTDFLGGRKSDRVIRVKKDDCR